MQTLDERVAFLEGRVDEHSRGVDDMRALVVQLDGKVDRRIDGLDGRFEAIDRRFEAVDRRFDAVDARFEAITLELLVERGAGKRGATPSTHVSKPSTGGSTPSTHVSRPSTGGSTASTHASTPSTGGSLLSRRRCPRWTRRCPASSCG